MLEKIFLLLMVMLAILTLNTPRLRTAVIYLGLFSLASSFTYLLYSAPDVAIAEAVIGSGIATVLYLVAIKKYQVFTIYTIHHDEHERLKPATRKVQTKLIRKIESMLVEKELEPHTIHTMHQYDFIQKNRKYDLIVDHEGNDVLIYGSCWDYHLDDVEKLVSGAEFDKLKIRIIRCEEGEGVTDVTQVD